MPLEPTDATPDFVVEQPLPSAVTPGTRIDRYEIESLIAAGGMGEVYRARDVDLGRPVALKVVRGDIVQRSPDALLREAQAMARLSHPNVIVVYQVGTVEGRVYLAMEYVEGQTLRGWLRARPRGWREALGVYLAAARGLAAAHRAGIVHRDFKPDNVLVGDDGRARVGDFGLAGDAPEAPSPGEPTEVAGADTVRFSRAASGTPGYMSPEQHLREPLDARSDQFSFCVALYEALYGRRPFAGDTLAELREAVVQHRVEPPARDALVPAWVRTAVLRGLARDRGARFPSMDALTAALEADPAVRRRRLLVGAALGGAAAVAVYGMSRPVARAPACAGGVAQLAGVWDDAVRGRVQDSFARSGKPYAADSFGRVAAALDRYAGDWTAMHHDACEATAVRHEQSPALLDLRMACLDRRLAGVRELAALFAADPKLVTDAAQAVYRLEPVASCADSDALTAVLPPPADPGARARVAALRARIDKATAMFIAGAYRPGLALAAQLVVEARALGYPPALAEILQYAGRLAQRLGNSALARASYEEAVVEAARARDAKLEAWGYTGLMHTIGWDQGRFAEALALVPAARAAAVRAGGLQAQARLANILGLLLGRQGRYEEALVQNRLNVELSTPAWGASSYEVGFARNGLAITLRLAGRPAEALPELELAREAWRKSLGPAHPYIGGVEVNICATEIALGRYDAAVASCRDALDLLERASGPDAPEVARALNNTALALRFSGRPAEAIPIGERGLRILEKTLGPEHPDLAAGLDTLARARIALHRDAEGLAESRRALAIREKALGESHIEVGVNLNTIAEALRDLGKLREARAAAERALAIGEKAANDAGRVIAASALVQLSAIALAERNGKEALAAAERAIALFGPGAPGSEAAVAARDRALRPGR